MRVFFSRAAAFFACSVARQPGAHTGQRKRRAV
jgi:hypothetical protein